jgi:molybdate transport system ATP-binding protein
MALAVSIRKKLEGFLLDVELEAGEEVLALLGASGCGKSMTLQCIAGIVTPDEGRIVLKRKGSFRLRAKNKYCPSSPQGRVSLPELRPFSEYDGSAEYCSRHS